jgi:hypothetical protein
MDRDLANRLSCVVCGIETKRHAGWFLVMENCWLDRVRVFSWHPVLAREGRMRGVCGKQHLKTLVTHWLNNANLQLVAGGHLPGRCGRHPSTRVQRLCLLHGQGAGRTGGAARVPFTQDRRKRGSAS